MLRGLSPLLAGLVGCSALAETPALIPAPAAPGYVDPDMVDSVGAVGGRREAEAEEKLPPFLRQVDYLRAHGDEAMVVSYLKKVVVNNPAVTGRDRARAILELADSLQRLNHPAETLCWLKIWLALFPGRPETAAVAYRIGNLYTSMSLPAPARDSYYMALSNAVNQGQVQSADDLKQYQRLTSGTLWALADNEYRAGKWSRAAELFDRYRKEAPLASASALAQGAYLQADCYYQLRQAGQARAAYVDALAKHPFHALAPEARLRLYHLDLLAHQPGQAQQELQALVWTVRTVWPEKEAYWQRRTADMLLALNCKDGTALPPLLAKSVTLSGQDKAWQGELAHYDKLAKFEAATMQTIPSSAPPGAPAAPLAGLREQDDLASMQRAIDELAPPKIATPVVVTASTP